MTDEQLDETIKIYDSVSVNGNADIQGNVTAQSVMVDGVTIPKRYVQTIEGDGNTPAYVIIHNLGNIPVVSIYDKDNKLVLASVSVTTTTISIEFYSPPKQDEKYTIVAVA